MENNNKQQNKGEIIIYRTPRGPELKVQFQQETIWLDAHQIAVLFDVYRPAIVKHINNIYQTRELNKNSTCSILEQVAADGRKRKMNLYNLDMIVSVGYRVNSMRATQFRIWATGILKEHLIKGATINQRRIQELKGEQLDELEKALILVEAARNKASTYDEASGLLEVITNYANTWLLLQKYDEGKLEIGQLTKKVKKIIDYVEAQKAIAGLKADLINKKEASDVFGQEKDKTLEGILASINQSFGGKQLYPSIEEKAAHLLYFIIKDHPFVDGNKRIASLLFILFLSRNNYLLNKKGQQKINPNTLVALALLIAESQPKQKEIMIKLIINFLNK
ncbi:type II toxin-antitoxin system death-on-curing family toxin [Patescibacteria group bacterium]|nr:type II toxin-antitoxin system death-on-curing family toxin [Patescibacteria group bacterium]